MQGLLIHPIAVEELQPGRDLEYLGTVLWRLRSSSGLRYLIPSFFLESSMWSGCLKLCSTLREVYVGVSIVEAQGPENINIKILPYARVSEVPAQRRIYGARSWPSPRLEEEKTQLPASHIHFKS